MLPRKWALKMSYTVMTQYIHLLTNNAATFLPTDLWVAATDKVPPMHAQQLALGLAKTTNDNRYEMSLEGYYKRMENVIQYQEQDADFNAATKSWEDLVVVGRGWSYGMEALLQKSLTVLRDGSGIPWPGAGGRFRTLTRAGFSLQIRPPP